MVLKETVHSYYIPYVNQNNGIMKSATVLKTTTTCKKKKYMVMTRFQEKFSLE